MNKKFEYHKEYPESVYKDRVYKWFNDNASTLDDADLQKFVNLCMRGNLTFQCVDEIDIDDPDISMIDHLLMDIALEKNNELINTYTDEIDWDNDYIEQYNRGSNMDKKLEARIARLEKMMNCKSVKNEAADQVANAVYRAADRIRQIVNDLCKTLAYSDISNYRDVEMALEVCENSFSKEANDRFNSIFEDRENGKEF